jgi:hypothetical protein
MSMARQTLCSNQGCRNAGRVMIGTRMLCRACYGRVPDNERLRVKRRKQG